MSIAASVVIKPSRQLACLLAVFGATLFSIAVYFALLAPVPGILLLADAGAQHPTQALLAGLLAPVVLVLASASFFYWSFRSRKSFRLDISGLGEIRLREHYTGVAAADGKSSLDSPGGDHYVVHLMEDSTLWPMLLALRFRTTAGASICLIVLPDMVGPDAFRALAVAIRWIAARQGFDAREEGNL
ncbi:MAG: flagellar hook-length control protein [Paucimonas sp.]|jgi:hypothetical protein|nr:flagellar hook-length control protein [Paucimonas sp.]